MTDSLIGRRLSHYDIREEVSRGAMGIVYRAVDVNLGREVALKVLPDDLVNDPVRRERLLHEARTASLVEHPHIAVIHEVGEAEGVTFIAMELIRGEKLSDVLGRGPLPPKRALELATEIGEGLARAQTLKRACRYGGCTTGRYIRYDRYVGSQEPEACHLP